MRFWFDTEFIEDGRTIDLISVGIVREDGSEYYSVSNEFNPEKASEWVKENVLSSLPPKNDPVYKSRAQIRDEVLGFIGQDNPEIWAYYADYDWVVLCQLFGTMMDIPEGWPMYCRDIKQLADDLGSPKLPLQIEGEHNALEDARWNKKTWEFLDRIKLHTFGDYHDPC